MQQTAAEVAAAAPGNLTGRGEAGSVGREGGGEKWEGNGNGGGSGNGTGRRETLSGNGKILSGKPEVEGTLPDKENFVGQGERTDKKIPPLPDKITERKGWIEYAKRGTKNPKRYAYRRRWIRNQEGKWVKSKVKRLKSIPPLTEGDYVKRIKSEGRDPGTGRKRRDRRNQRDRKAS